jgi:ABC-2 type transport system ATP-binding protein
MVMIQVSNLNKRFGSFHALKGIDLTVEKNDIYGFLGHNGAGKSTTINILAGLSRIDSGKCIVNGRCLDAKLNAGQKGVGYLPEDPSFYSWMTAREYLMYIGSDYDGKTANRVQEMLEWVDLKKAANRRIGGFSRGMKQRLGMAVALFYNPDLLLLDEPSSALDPQGRSDVLNMIKRLKDDGKTIFLSTHILDDVERVCNKVGILSSGEMVAEMELSKLLDKYVAPIYDMTFASTPTEDEVSQIKSSKWIKSLDIQNNMVTIRVDDKDSEDHKIYALAGKMQTPIKSVVQRQNSLEEIFISITGKGGEKCDKQ